MQISIDGATPETNDPVRGRGSYAMARRGMDRLAEAGFGPFKISVVMTRHNIPELDALEAIAREYGAQLRITRLRPSGRGASVWDELHPTAAQQRELYDWLITRPDVLTGDSFFHLSALGEPLPGLNLCGAGRVVCLVDPVGDVYACPFVLHDEFLAGNVRDPGGFEHVWRESELFTELREPQSAGACASCGLYDRCQGGCMAAKFFTGMPLDGPDPECVLGHGELELVKVAADDRPARIRRATASERGSRCPAAGSSPSRSPSAALGGRCRAPSTRRSSRAPSGARRCTTTSPRSASSASRPHVAEAPAQRDQSVSVMGQQLALPVLISPTGVQAVHPEGEVAVARAAAARGTAIGLSSFGSKPVEEVVAANPHDVLSDLLVRHPRADLRAAGASQGRRASPA